MSKIKISEIFESIQGEGRHVGVPMLFIRVSECTRVCDFCDTSYHWKGKEISLTDLAKEIEKSKRSYICWTGGEPLLYKEDIKKMIEEFPIKYHHIETNGDLFIAKDIEYFDHITISPKEKVVAKRAAEIKKYSQEEDIIDIKVVTDLDKIGIDMLQYATSLMPLTIYNTKKDLEIKQKVWQYCDEYNLEYSPRIQVDVWGKKRKV